MSLDITLYLETKVSYDRGITWADREEIVYDANITHNLNVMADKAGIYEALWRPEKILKESSGELIEIIEEGLNKLKSNPEFYKKYNPENGWGNYDGLVSFVEKYLKACKEYPNAKIRISR